jgi:hypothetical protein
MALPVCAGQAVFKAVLMAEIVAQPQLAQAYQMP